MQDNIFIDSNIWLYAFMEGDFNKNIVANKLIKKKNIVISVQVVNEICFNLIRKSDYNENDIYSLLQNLRKKYFINKIDFESVIQSNLVRKKYAISFWDSHIIASALINNCSVLYSEDMQNNQIIENKLKISNPFL